jgi:hypothetical protein
LLFAICISCSEGDVKPLVKTIKLDFKNSTNEKGTGESYSIDFNFDNPLLSNSDFLIVEVVVNAETGKSGYLIKINEAKIKEKKSAEPPKVPAPPTETQGYWFDGNCCFIYGTWTTFSTGYKIFTPADPATQSLMNNCNYCDVA